MFSVQFITHFTECISYRESAVIALKGGCRWIQLRMKGASDEEVEQTALEILPLCREAGATFLLDDRVDLAMKIRADGVHLGKNDMPIRTAREKMGRSFLIGGTANTLDDVRRHFRDGADYIGCGPFRFTTTKEKLSPVLGTEGYRHITDGMKEEGIRLPVVGIGGVTAEDIPRLHRVGLDGIALSGSVLRAPDPVAEMERVLKIANNI